MNNQAGTIVVIAVIIIALLLVFRGCKQIDIKQRSTDDKTEVSFEVKKDRC